MKQFFRLLPFLLCLACSREEHEELDFSEGAQQHLKCTLDEFDAKGNLKRQLLGSYTVVHTTSGKDTVVYNGITARFHRNSICLYQNDSLLSEADYELSRATWEPFQHLVTTDSKHPLNGLLLVVCKGNIVIQTRNNAFYDVVPDNGPPEIFLQRIE